MTSLVSDDVRFTLEALIEEKLFTSLAMVNDGVEALEFLGKKGG